VLPTGDASVASYSVSAPVVAAPPGATDPVAFVQALAAAVRVGVGPGTHEERLRARVAVIQATGRGRTVARGEAGYDEAPAANADAAWTTLVSGGCWIDDPAETAVLAVHPPVPSSAVVEAWRTAPTQGLALVTFAARGTVGTTPPSPLLTKLYQESDLRPAATIAALGPATAARLRLAQGQPIDVDTPAGVVRAAVRIDSTLPPDRVALAAGPDSAALHPGLKSEARGALPLVATAADATWRETRVRVREA
jgi:hypothetical protein